MRSASWRSSELRRKAEAALGSKFQHAGFPRDVVLADGSLPLDVLESRVEHLSRAPGDRLSGEGADRTNLILLEPGEVSAAGDVRAFRRSRQSIC